MGARFALSAGKWPGEKCMISSMDARNRRAHAGLGRNMVEGKVDEGEFEVSCSRR